MGIFPQEARGDRRPSRHADARLSGGPGCGVGSRLPPPSSSLPLLFSFSSSLLFSSLLFSSLLFLFLFFSSLLFSVAFFSRPISSLLLQKHEKEIKKLRQ